MAFQWKERYSLGIEEVDKQHKRLFELGARVYDLSLSADVYDRFDEIMAVLGELMDYTQYHFKFEEALQEQYGFPVYSHHTKEHAYFISKIKSISVKDIDSDQGKTLQDIIEFLSEWISSHITLEDRKYASFFKEKGMML